MDVSVPMKVIKGKIYLVRGQKVLLDSDLAGMYGIETKNLNKAVKRNLSRFPQDYMFQLTDEESKGLRFQVGTANEAGHGGSYHNALRFFGAISFSFRISPGRMSSKPNMKVGAADVKSPDNREKGANPLLSRNCNRR